MEISQNSFIFATKIKTIDMKNTDYIDNKEIEMLDKAPKSYAEANLRIEEAEKGISNGEVVPHEYVMKHSYELLRKYGC